MKQRFLQGAIVLLLCAMLAVGALADVIWEPDDSFYTRHADECEYVNRWFVANSEEGGVRIYESPDSDRVQITADNGTRLIISFTYQDKWGVVEYAEEDEKIVNSYGGTTGWVHLADFYVEYDTQAFSEQHESEFFEDADKTQAFLDALPEEGELVFYTYPCSGVISSHLPVEDAAELKLGTLYEDSEGRLWGYAGYLYGPRDWVCMSAPQDEEIAEVEYAETPTLYPAQQIEPYPDGAPGLATTTILAIILVAAVVVVSLVLILLTRRRSRRQDP